MKPTNVWQVMTPLKDYHGQRQWLKTLFVAVYEHEAIRLIEQTALRQGFSFVGDIKVQHVHKAITETGLEVVLTNDQPQPE